MNRSNTLRVIAVVGLLSAAFFAALPWLGCMTSFGNLAVTFGPCTYQSFPSLPGQAVALPGFTHPPYWGYLILAIAYLVAAVYVALSKRS